MSPFGIFWLCIFLVFVVVIARLMRRREHRPSDEHTLPARAPRTARPPTITLTPRQIERVNIQRKLRGRAPLSRIGLQNAIAHPWDRPARPPQSTNDWLTYLILWDVINADHASHSVSNAGGVIIDPDQPYNGQGGKFAGAGASGAWTDDRRAQAAADAIVYDLPIVGAPVPDETGKYQPGDVVGGYRSAPDPTPSPSYSAPDPSPSYSAPDPSPSSSFDSSSSSSSFDSNGGNP